MSPFQIRTWMCREGRIDFNLCNCTMWFLLFLFRTSLASLLPQRLTLDARRLTLDVVVGSEHMTGQEARTATSVHSQLDTQDPDRCQQHTHADAHIRVEIDPLDGSEGRFGKRILVQRFA